MKRQSTERPVLTDTLALTHVSFDNAREFPGYASIATVGGKLLVSDGSEPVITQVEITPNLTWVEGESLSFTELRFEIQGWALDLVQVR